MVFELENWAIDATFGQQMYHQCLRHDLARQRSNYGWHKAYQNLASERNCEAILTN
jgi:hypothetical protein